MPGASPGLWAKLLTTERFTCFVNCTSNWLLKSHSMVAGPVVQSSFSKEALLECIRNNDLRLNWLCSNNLNCMLQHCFSQVAKITDLRYLKCQKHMFLIMLEIQPYFREYHHHHLSSPLRPHGL